MKITFEAPGGVAKFPVPISLNVPTVEVNSSPVTVSLFQPGFITLASTPTYGQTVEVTLDPVIGNLKVPKTPNVSWGSAGNDSDAIDLGEQSLVGLQIGATFVGTSVSFKVSDTIDGTYRPLNDSSGTLISYTVAVNTALPVDIVNLNGARFLKIVSGGTEVINTTVGLVTREVG